MLAEQPVLVSKAVESLDQCYTKIDREKLGVEKIIKEVNSFIQIYTFSGYASTDLPFSFLKSDEPDSSRLMRSVSVSSSMKSGVA